MNRIQLAIYLLNIIKEAQDLTYNASDETIAKVDALTEHLKTETAVQLYAAWKATCQFAYKGDWQQLINDHDNEWTPEHIDVFKATYPGLFKETV